MSRTYRKPRWPNVELSEVEYINRELKWVRGQQRAVYERVANKERYDSALKTWRSDVKYYAWLVKTYADSSRPDAQEYYERYVATLNNLLKKKPKQEQYFSLNITYVPYTDDDVEKCISDSKKEYKKYTRDGRFSETSRRTGYKKDSAKIIRRANRKLEHDVIVGNEEWKHHSYPDRHLGKPKIWNWW